MSWWREIKRGPMRWWVSTEISAFLLVALVALTFLSFVLAALIASTVAPQP